MLRLESEAAHLAAEGAERQHFVQAASRRAPRSGCLAAERRREEAAEEQALSSSAIMANFNFGEADVAAADLSQVTLEKPPEDADSTVRTGIEGEMQKQNATAKKVVARTPGRSSC